MSTSIEPMQERDLPERTTSFWRMTGPGAVMVGLAIGSGELIMWPWITARFGETMIWAAALGVFVQLWINIEIGRWAIATGESTFTGFARISRFTTYYFMALLAILALLPVWARATGVALKILIFGTDGPGADWMWTALVFVIVLCTLFGPKRIYSAVEVSVTLMVCLIVGGMLFVAIRVGTFSDVATMGRGLVNVGHIELTSDFTALSLFGAIVFAGAGGFGNLFYAYYLRDKGIGMGAHVPVLENPLRGTEQRMDDAGFVFPENEGNARRFRDWFKFVILDNTLYFWLLNTFTMLLFMFGALVVLHAQGIVPDRNTLLWDLATMLESSMGVWGRYLFLIIAMAALFSTQLTATDGSARVWGDMLRSNFKFARNIAHNRFYLVLVLTVASLGVFSVWFFDTFENQTSVLDLFFLNAGMNGFAMALYCPLLLYMNFKYLPPSARPKPINVVMVMIGSAVYISFAVYLIVNKISSMIG